MKLKYIIVVSAVLLTSMIAFTSEAFGQAYNSGSYGSCDYGRCSIAVSSSETVSLGVTPSAAGSCSINRDEVSVSTNSATGYTLQLAGIDATTAMAKSSGESIPAGNGTVASPSMLTSNTWGYRVDGGAFGNGPTTAVVNAPMSSLTFAGLPPSGSPASIVSRTTKPSNPDKVLVWYGVCLDTGAAAGSYTASVRYTAVVN